MQEDYLEELRKGFLEAIAAHKFIELKFGSDRSVEINKLKQQWERIKLSLTIIPDLDTEKNIISSKNKNLELQLLKLQRQLESTKSQLQEQQIITKNLIRQNSTALKEIQELRNSISISPTLEFTTLDDM